MIKKSLVFCSAVFLSLWGVFGLTRHSNAQQFVLPLETRESASHFHIVQSGESLWGIADDYRLTMPDLVAANLLHGPTSIFPGDRLYIPYNPSPGRSKPLQFVELINFSDPIALKKINPQKEHLVWPTGLAPISQAFHDMHHGLDLSLPIGTPILATASGEVIRTDFDHPIYGQVIVIDHGDEILTIYAHLSYISVQEGYIVLQGEEIGLSGNSGRSTNPHLHFEIRQSGQFFDPCHYLVEGCHNHN